MSRHSTRPRRRIARFITRSVAGLLVLTAISAGVGFHYWTDPVTVRRLVLERLRMQFPGAEISLDSARVWPGWGIAVTNLTLCRKDDPSLTPVLQVPTGRIEADAAQLARGRLRVRRVKLDRARITAVRDRDGRWNLDGILSPPQPNLPLPTIVLERGTVLVRVATPTSGESVWEIAAARAALVEEQLGLAHFECRGDSTRIGSLALQGTWRRARGEIDMALDLSAVPIHLDLLQELARLSPMPLESIVHCSGIARVHLDSRRRPDALPAWQTELRFGLTKGCVGIRELPVDFDEIEIDARLAGGRLTINDAHAFVAGAPVRGQLVARVPATNPVEAIETAQVSVDRLLVTPELFTRLPERAQKFHQRFAPVGRVSLDYQFAKRRSAGWDARVELRPDNVAGRYQKFPYPLRQVRGTVVTELASDRPSHHTVNVSCEVNGDDRFALSGVVCGEEPNPSIDLQITSADPTKPAEIEIDDDLIRALPVKFQPLARSFHCRGKCSVTGRIHRAEGRPHGHDQYLVRFRDCNVCYDAFALPLEHANGDLELHLGPGLPDDPNTGDHWRLRNATAAHAGGRIIVAAHDEPAPTGKRLVIDIGGEQVPLAEPLAKALSRYRLRPVWDLLAPSGVFDFTSRVTLTDQPNGPPRSEVTLGLRGATLKPAFFPYALTHLNAHVHATGNQVLLGECAARHGATTLRFSGGEVRTQGGLWIDLRNVRATALTADAEFVGALPASFQRACAALKPRGTFNVDVQRLVYFDPPAIPGPPGPPVLQWDGALTLNDAAFATGVSWSDINGTIACRGTVRGNRLESLTGHAALDTAAVLHQPLNQIHAQLAVDPETPDVLQVRRLSGRVFGGDLTGEARVVFGSGLDYALDVKLLGAQLQEFGKHNHVGEGQLAGTTTAQLYLTGRGASLDELTGRGEIDVPSGRIYDLPLLLELLRAAALRAPDGVAFDEAHAIFKIQGKQLMVERLDLLGTAVSLGGRGRLDLNGENVDLDFYAVWARIAQVLPVGLRDMPPWISQKLLKIKMRGSLAQPSFTGEPVPFIVEPVKQLLETVGSRQ